MSLRTDYKDAIYSGNKKYNMIRNGDGTVSFEDKTTYYEFDDTSLFGANDINQTNEKLNQILEMHENGTLSINVRGLDMATGSEYKDDTLVILSSGGKLYRGTLKTLANYLARVSPKFAEPTDVYWGNGSWTCPADGFLVIKVTSSNVANYTLTYISDTKNDIKGSIYGEGSGGTFTTTIPVYKGVTYKTGYIFNTNSIKAIYSKLGQ
nr:MAG TPA: hypothetical protein [Caudoviricetes sp.]